MMQQQLITVCAGIISLGMAGSVGAELQERLGGKAYYDTDTDLTWLADANYAKTENYSKIYEPVDGSNGTGRMTWDDAKEWVERLNVDGVTGWRLPNSIVASDDSTAYRSNDGAGAYYDFNKNVVYDFKNTPHNELANMFYNVLGNSALFNRDGNRTDCGHQDNCLTKTDPFSNLRPGGYWTATEVSGSQPMALLFKMHSGKQVGRWTAKGESYPAYAWAVRAGDVEERNTPSAPVMLE